MTTFHTGKVVTSCLRPKIMLFVYFAWKREKKKLTASLKIGTSGLDPLNRNLTLYLQATQATQATRHASADHRNLKLDGVVNRNL